MREQKGLREGRGRHPVVPPTTVDAKYPGDGVRDSFASRAEVTSIILGLDVNSPYGISEPWVTIREGLLRLDYIDSVASLPDRKNATGELRTKNGRVPDVDALGTAIRELGAGATLRGVEATVVGDVVKQGVSLMLKRRYNGRDPAPRTAHQTRATRRRRERNRTQCIRRIDIAFEPRRFESADHRPAARSHRTGRAQTLEVRIFDFPGRKLRTKPKIRTEYARHSFPHSTGAVASLVLALGLSPAAVHGQTSGQWSGVQNWPIVSVHAPSPNGQGDVLSLRR